MSLVYIYNNEIMLMNSLVNLNKKNESYQLQTLYNHNYYYLGEERKERLFLYAEISK